jgi:hypothetical protein
MKKLYSKTLQMPHDAAYIQLASKSGSVYTVNYFRENHERISQVSPAAGVIHEDTYKHVISEAPEPMKKVDQAPKGKATEDPRRNDQKKRQDLPRGRDLTKAEKEVGAAHQTHPGEKRRDEDKPTVGVKSRAKEPRGKVKGENQFEGVYLGLDPLLDQINEDDNNTLYRWQAILEAIFAAGLTEDQAREIRANLHGKEYSLGESTQSFNEASPEPSGVAQVDNDLAAVAGAQSSQEGEKNKNEVYVGMDAEEAEEALDTVPKREAEKIQNLNKGVVIHVVRIRNGKVSKVIPTTVIKVVYNRPNFYAHCRVDADQVTRIKVARDPNVVYLRQGEKTGVYYYIDRGDPSAERNPTIAYN